MTGQTPSGGQAVQETGLLRRRVGQIATQVGGMGLALFVAAGTVRWWWAWVYFAVVLILLVLNYWLIPREVIAERARARPNVKRWDKIIVNLILLLTIAMLVTAGLDFRLSLSPTYAPLWHWLALVVLVVASLGFTWSTRANHFFSTRVRIQSERGHTVATGGPYRFVRHPGYVALISSNLATPALLGSLWALIPAGAIAALYVVRTALEDKTLLAELPGYTEYSQRTRYRLLPGIW